MKQLFFTAILFFYASAFAAPKEQSALDPLDAYFHYLKTYPHTLGPWGNASLGEIEIVQERAKIAEIEKSIGRTAGVVAEDKYWIWLNDPVKFPSGKYGVYGRLLWRGALNGVAGVAVMPMLSNGKIVLIRTFRHATRSWEYELPRGARGPEETAESAALREIKEETGVEVDKLHSLGEMAVDTGFTTSVVPLFLGKVIHKGEARPEDSEAIASVEAFSVEELKQGLVNGFLSVEIAGKICKISLRDPFLAFALLQAETRSLLHGESSAKEKSLSSR